MQTFLPEDSLAGSVACLDLKRLGKQRVEGYQLLLCLTGERCTGWKHHPAAKMWATHELYLAMYTQCACLEWLRRGYVDSVMDKVNDVIARHPGLGDKWPKHLFTKDVRDSHRSALLRKLPIHYQTFAWGVPDNLPYVWPR